MIWFAHTSTQSVRKMLIYDFCLLLLQFHENSISFFYHFLGTYICWELSVRRYRSRPHGKMRDTEECCEDVECEDRRKGRRHHIGFPPLSFAVEFWWQFFCNTAGSISRRIACIVSKIEWGDSRQQMGLKIQTNAILLSFSDSNLFSKSVHPFAVNAHTWTVIKD